MIKQARSKKMFGILARKVAHATDGIDTPEQYAEFVKRYKSS